MVDMARNVDEIAHAYFVSSSAPGIAAFTVVNIAVAQILALC